MGRHIVVIDDERDVLQILCDILEDEGFTVVCLDRPHSPETLHKLADPALFLIDIMLPGTSGIDVARELREDDFTDVPMIAMSASMSMIAAARSTGLFQDALSKPFDLDVLLEHVTRHAS